MDKKVRDHNFQDNFFGHVKLDNVFHIKIIWLSFDKKNDDSVKITKGAALSSVRQPPK